MNKRVPTLEKNNKWYQSKGPANNNLQQRKNMWHQKKVSFEKEEGTLDMILCQNIQLIPLRFNHWVQPETIGGNFDSLCSVSNYSQSHKAHRMLQSQKLKHWGATIGLRHHLSFLINLFLMMRRLLTTLALGLTMMIQRLSQTSLLE